MLADIVYKFLGLLVVCVLWHINPCRFCLHIDIKCVWGFPPTGVVDKVLDSGFEVSKFEFQSRYYVHFRTNTLGENMNPFNPHLWVK